MNAEAPGSWAVVIRALAYLQWTGMRNNLRVRLLRLRQPKYLVGAVMGCAYLAFYFGQSLLWNFRSTGGDGGGGWFAEHRTAAMGLASLGVLAYVVASWVLPGSRAALQFTEAELAFLLSAPLSRRALIHFKLLKSQVPLLVTAAVFALLGSRGGGDGGSWIFRWPGWWLLLFTLNLHGIAASFVLTRLLDAGLTRWPRRAIVLTIFAAAAAGMAAWTWKGVPGAPEPGSPAADWWAWITEALTTGPLHGVLTPFRWVVRPWFARDFPEFLGSLPAPLALLAAHYAWVIAVEVSFEEASLAAARRRTELQSMIRAGRNPLTARPASARRAFFRLAPTGFPPVALLWKNLIAAGSAVNRRLLLALGIWVIVASAMASGGMAGPKGFTAKVVVSAVALVALGASVFFGPQILRGDFRQDYECMDVLKTFPLPGWQVVLGQLLAPALMLTAVQWALLVLLLAATATGTVRLERVILDLDLRLALAGCFALLLPGFNLLAYVVPNAVVLVFPAWAQPRRDGPGGVEVMGQRLLVALGTMCVMFLGLAPAALLFFGAFLLASSRFDAPMIGLVLGGAAGLLVFLAESAVGVFLLGKVFERFDLSRE